MKVFVTGTAGQLGCDLMKELEKRGYEAVGADIAEMDITDSDAVDSIITAEAPDAVIHCAAWTAVDAAEEPENYDKVMAVNAGGTENIARVCGRLGCKLIYISTDYVFDGSGDTPWKPDDRRDPLNVYGLSKYKGELAVEKFTDKYFIIRIAWVFGKNGSNFVKTMLRLGKERDTITVVDDQIGTPTYTWDLSRLLVDMAETEKYGRYHATNEGEYISWYDFTLEIMRQAEKYDPEYGRTSIIPVSSGEYKTKAKRPSNSRMDRSRLKDRGFEPLPHWKDALGRYLKEIVF